MHRLRARPGSETEAGERASRPCEDAAARKLPRDPSIRGSNASLAAKAVRRARIGRAIRRARKLKQLRPHCRKTTPADFLGGIGSMPGSGNAVSLSSTCTREEHRVNQAERLAALKQRVAKAPARPVSGRPGPLALLPVRAAILCVSLERRVARRPEAKGRALAANSAATALRRIDGGKRIVGHGAHPRQDRKGQLEILNAAPGSRHRRCREPGRSRATTSNRCGAPSIA